MMLRGAIEDSTGLQLRTDHHQPGDLQGTANDRKWANKKEHIEYAQVLTES